MNHAIEIAEEYDDPAYTEAAETLRLPYWDWAEDSTVPAFAGTAQIEVEGPDGKENIANPLYEYKFPASAVKGDFGAIIGGDRDKTKTIRCSPDQANQRLAEVDFKGMVVSSPHATDKAGHCERDGFADGREIVPSLHPLRHLR